MFGVVLGLAIGVILLKLSRVEDSVSCIAIES
jgi:hypothetical protein